MIARALALTASMLVSIAASWALTPRVDMVAPGEFSLAEIVPREFGSWREVPSLLAQVDVAVRRDQQAENSQLYDEVLSRTYRSASGEVVMLSIAYGRQQRQEVKIHRPELCYAAQGFEVDSGRVLDSVVARGAGAVDGRAFLALKPGRIEQTVYWIRVGGLITTNAWSTRMYLVTAGVRGVVPDGVLVRTSEIISSRNEAEASIVRQKKFVDDLIEAMDPPTRDYLLGSSPTESPLRYGFLQVQLSWSSTPC